MWPRNRPCRRRRREYRHRRKRLFCERTDASDDPLLELVRGQRGQLVDVESLGLVCELLRLHGFLGGRLILGRGLDGAPRCRPNRGDEVLLAAIPELDLPGDRALLLLAKYPDAVAQGREVGVAAGVDGVLRARLDA